MSEQYLSTSRLGNVIRLIGLGRQTGLLRVVRGQGATREEGEVQFVDGQIASATVGQLSGGAALAILQQWGESWYLFLDGVNRLQGTNTSQSLGWGPGVTGDMQPPASSGSYPSSPSYTPQPGYGSQPPYGSNPGGSQPPYRSNPGTSQPPYGSNPGTSQPPYGAPEYGAGYATNPMTAPSGPMGPMGPSGPLPPNNRPYDSGSLPGQGYPSGPQVIPPQVMQRLADYSAILRRLSMQNPVDMPQLDRRERQMLLLIDNRRTIGDLVRLTRRSDDEIRSILAHLIILGLVE
jgi:hypothetical protein